MKFTILRPNAAPIYAFLSRINAHTPLDASSDASEPKKILDCGAGGRVPPLALFRQHGFESWGIDISSASLAQARAFCREHDLDIHLRLGDMRSLPFEAETFDHVYEHYSMCHLDKSDTAVAIAEMQRVLKPGGLCFLGVISTDTWPTTLLGEERKPGEFIMEEDGESTRHTLFSDDEADGLVADWHVVSREKHTNHLLRAAQEMSLQTWAGLYKETEGAGSRDEWAARYDRRAAYVQYVHLYYVLQKRS